MDIGYFNKTHALTFGVLVSASDYSASCSHLWRT